MEHDPSDVVHSGHETSPVLPETSLRRLHECERCDSRLVYPVDWDEAGSETWSVHLRCPNCESRTCRLFDQEMAEHFDEEIDAGTEMLVADLKRLMQANMAEEIDRFVKALAAGAILPEDF